MTGVDGSWGNSLSPLQAQCSAAGPHGSADWTSDRLNEAGGPKAARDAREYLLCFWRYWSSDRTCAGAWLAWASIAWPAWARMEYFVYCTISDAMSTSRIRLSAATRFSW